MENIQLKKIARALMCIAITFATNTTPRTSYSKEYDVHQNELELEFNKNIEASGLKVEQSAAQKRQDMQNAMSAENTKAIAEKRRSQTFDKYQTEPLNDSSKNSTIKTTRQINKVKQPSTEYEKQIDVNDKQSSYLRCYNDINGTLVCKSDSNVKQEYSSNKKVETSINFALTGMSMPASKGIFLLADTAEGAEQQNLVKTNPNQFGAGGRFGVDFGSKNSKVFGQVDFNAILDQQNHSDQGMNFFLDSKIGFESISRFKNFSIGKVIGLKAFNLRNNNEYSAGPGVSDEDMEKVLNINQANLSAIAGLNFQQSIRGKHFFKQFFGIGAGANKFNNFNSLSSSAYGASLIGLVGFDYKYKVNNSFSINAFTDFQYNFTGAITIDNPLDNQFQDSIFDLLDITNNAIQHINDQIMDPILDILNATGDLQSNINEIIQGIDEYNANGDTLSSDLIQYIFEQVGYPQELLDTLPLLQDIQSKCHVGHTCALLEAPFQHMDQLTPEEYDLFKEIWDYFQTRKAITSKNETVFYIPTGLIKSPIIIKSIAPNGTSSHTTLGFLDTVGGFDGNPYPTMAEFIQTASSSSFSEMTYGISASGSLPSELFLAIHYLENRNPSSDSLMDFIANLQGNIVNLPVYIKDFLNANLGSENQDVINDLTQSFAEFSNTLNHYLNESNAENNSLISSIEVLREYFKDIAEVTDNIANSKIISDNFNGGAIQMPIVITGLGFSISV